MSEFTNRQQPTRQPVALAELELIVRPPGDPNGIRAFTAAEVGAADQYAASVGATVEPLPLPYP